MSVSPLAGSCILPSPESIIKASNSVRNDSFAGRAFCPRIQTALKMSSKESEEPWLERWRFIKQLPHRILRDIGFTILSPPILLDSHQLPLVSPDVLGGGTKTWLDSAKWLATVEVDQVKQWFGAKSNNGRLGEHFAFCVEYVLRFSPFVEVRNLMTYQQVTQRMAHGSRSQAPEPGKKDGGSITVEVEKEDVLIELNHGFDYKSSKSGGHSDLSISIVKEATEDVVAACDSFQKQVALDEGNMFVLDKAENSEGNTSEVISESRLSTSEKIGRRKRKLLRKMQRLKDGSGVMVTIGEFDFLFEQSIMAKQDHQVCLQSSLDSRGLSQIEETMISHWEVSVKFLLYAGPWEVVGFRTPCHAAWKCSSQGSQEEEIICAGDVRLQDEKMFRSGESRCVKKDDWHVDKFLGCFLGPHVGETLYNRKTRLMNQLTLSQNIHAASLLCKLFGLTHNEESNVPLHHSSDENPCLISGRRETGSSRARVLRVSPRALLKGYLFYEYDLWCQLRSREQLVNEGTQDGNVAGNMSFTTELNPHHWMGWWTRTRDFLTFARLPIHEHSKWYIVPKLEWLSPVVIDSEDKERNRQMFSLDEFLVVAGKVAEEAERLNIQRKRRFLVAEVVWEMTTTSCHTCDSAADSEGSVEGSGKWTEVSRGFVVEDTWPDSRLYEPHGYRMPLSHASQ